MPILNAIFIDELLLWNYLLYTENTLRRMKLINKKYSLYYSL